MQRDTCCDVERGKQLLTRACTAKDDEARSPADPDILEDKPLSVVSGRSIPEIAQGKGRKRVWHSNRSVKDNVTTGATKGNASAARRASNGNPSQKSARSPRASATKKKSAKKSASKSKEAESRPQGAPLPDFVPPSLATLRAAAPSGEGWVHEIKFDGYRALCRISKGEVRLLTRSNNDWTEKFQSIADQMADLPIANAILDGEITSSEMSGHDVVRSPAAGLE